MYYFLFLSMITQEHPACKIEKIMTEQSVCFPIMYKTQMHCSASPSPTITCRPCTFPQTTDTLKPYISYLNILTMHVMSCSGNIYCIRAVFHVRGRRGWMVVAWQLGEIVAKWETTVLGIVYTFLSQKILDIFNEKPFSSRVIGNKSGHFFGETLVIRQTRLW